MVVLGVSGPSSSGKTTLSRALRDLFEWAGVPTVLVHEDDFYLDEERWEIHSLFLFFFEWIVGMSSVAGHSLGIMGAVPMRSMVFLIRQVSCRILVGVKDSLLIMVLHQSSGDARRMLW